MAFTSSIFLIGFLPWLALFFYFTKNWKHSKRNLILIANTLLLYGGGVTFILTCMFSVVIYILSIIVSKTKNKVIFAISLCIALIPLLAVKYTGFIVENVSLMLKYGIQVPDIIVPIGISFYTFEAISMLCDIHSDKIEGKISLPDVYSYLTFFPTVTSGPIIRLKDFKTDLNERAGAVNYACAVERIAAGLCKKVLIADKVAVLADYYFNGTASGNTYSCLGLWIGSITYTLQLYFDFSGYADMAVGVGQLFGFNMPENFNKPYQAGSISDFWRRWHISLSRWFRDYIYIPTGGSRCSAYRHVRNLFIVWILTGIWHGAAWKFVIWGLGYLMLLLLEKYVPIMRNIEKHWWGHLYALFFINILWIPFRADNLYAAGRYISGMFGVNGLGMLEEKAVLFLPYIIGAALLCLPWNLFLEKYCQKKWYRIIRGALITLLAGLAVCALINALYTPYIYGNF